MNQSVAEENGGRVHCAGRTQFRNWLTLLSPPFSYQYDEEGDSEDEDEEGSEDEEVGVPLMRLMSEYARANAILDAHVL